MGTSNFASARSAHTESHALHLLAEAAWWYLQSLPVLPTCRASHLPCAHLPPPLRQVRLQRQPGSFTKKACRAACTRKQLPLYSLYCGTQCACSASIPALSAQTRGCRAGARDATCGSKIELQYIYSGMASLGHRQRWRACAFSGAVA
jgi:hypothetical protein